MHIHKHNIHSVFSSFVRYSVLLLFLFSMGTVPSDAQTRRKATTTKTQKRKTTKKSAKKVDQKTQLRNEKDATARKRQEQQRRAQQLTRNIKANLDSVIVINGQITSQKRSIDSLSTEMRLLQAQIDSMEVELKRLEKELQQRRKQYARSLLQQRKQKTVQQRLTFIFSADNLAQIMRRMRYMREYMTYQRAQGELLMIKQQEVNAARDKLLGARARMQINMETMEKHQKGLENLRARCQSKANLLNRNLSATQRQIREYQKKEQALEDQIEKLIQAEIEAERRRREEAERRRQEEEARMAAQGDGKSTKKKSKTTESAKGSKIEKFRYSDENTKLSSNFTSNKGRLPMPVTGGYNIVRHFGTYNVQGLRNVTLNSKGIDIRAQRGASARAIFDGEVSSIFQYGSTYIVMLRHGSYISVYSGMKSVSVRKGQKVKTRDTLGVIGTDADGHYTLHFQLRRESTLLNPENWVR